MFFQVVEDYNVMLDHDEDFGRTIYTWGRDVGIYKPAESLSFISLSTTKGRQAIWNLIGFVYALK